MRNFGFAVLVACILLLSQAARAEDIDTYGQSDEDILAMGQSAWFEFYTSRAGDSTMEMVNALEVYTAAAKRRNETLPQAHFNVGELRRLLGEYANTAVGLSYNIAGGGTIWTLVGAGASCDIEEVIFAILGGDAPPAEPTTTGEVKRGMEYLGKQIEDLHADPDATYFHYVEGVADLAKLRTQFDAIAKLAAGLDRANSDRVLALCNGLLAGEDRE
jgi:hypothetical protein